MNNKITRYTMKKLYSTLLICLGILVWISCSDDKNIGELLDIYGESGGYNLSLAFLTGLLVGDDLNNA